MWFLLIFASYLVEVQKNGIHLQNNVCSCQTIPFPFWQMDVVKLGRRWDGYCKDWGRDVHDLVDKDGYNYVFQEKVDSKYYGML